MYCISFVNAVYFWEKKTRFFFFITIVLNRVIKLCCDKIYNFIAGIFTWAKKKDLRQNWHFLIHIHREKFRYRLIFNIQLEFNGLIMLVFHFVCWLVMLVVQIKIADSIARICFLISWNFLVSDQDCFGSNEQNSFSFSHSYS